MAAKLNDPWKQTVVWLSALSCTTGGATLIGKRVERDHSNGTLTTVSVDVIERLSSSTAIVAWRDPTSCCYGDQIWRESIARGQGVCAATNQRIDAGDRIYKPRACKVMRKNAQAMILASVVQGYPRRSFGEI